MDEMKVDAMGKLQFFATSMALILMAGHALHAGDSALLTARGVLRATLEHDEAIRNVSLNALWKDRLGGEITSTSRQTLDMDDLGRIRVRTFDLQASNPAALLNEKS